jgi:hypothetical protein
MKVLFGQPKANAKSLKYSKQNRVNISYDIILAKKLDETLDRDKDE